MSSPNLGLQRMLERIICTIVETLPSAEGGLIFLLDGASQRFTVQAAHQLSLSQEQLKYVSFASNNPEQQRWIMAERRAIIVPHAQYDDRLHPGLRRVGMQSLLSTPLLVNGRLWGVLNLFNWNEGTAFSENDLEIVSIHADLAAAAIKNAQLYQVIEEERQAAAALAQMTQIVNSTLELNQVLNLALEQLAQVITYDMASILLADGMKMEIAACRGGIDPDLLIGNSFYLTKDDISYHVMRNQRARVIADVHRLAQWHHHYHENGTRTIGAWIGAPLVVQGESIGLLIIDKNEPNFYTEQDKEMAAAFAAQIATALRNARLFDSLRHKALEVAVMADNLTEEKSKLDAILKNIADGLVVTDLEGAVLLANPAFKKMFKQTKTMEQLPRVEELRTLINKAMTHQTSTFMEEIPLMDGRICKASSAAIQEETRFLGVVTVLRDITQEKEVDRMKSEFISTVSHELRTPLTSILGFARHIDKIFKKNIVPKIVLEDRKDQRTVHYIEEELEIITTEGERLTRLINDLLDIAKMEAGKLDWEMEQVTISEVIHQAIAATSALANIKKLPVKIDLAKDLPPVWADDDRLIQVTTNLLSNAIKFTDEGEITIKVTNLEITPESSLVPQLKSGEWVIVQVQDTGIGIAQADMDQVFHKFKQVGDVLTDRPKGTGLGLTICKEIIEQHQGHIWVESQLKVGTTFTFALPITNNTERGDKK